MQECILWREGHQGVWEDTFLQGRGQSSITGLVVYQGKWWLDSWGHKFSIE